MHAAAYVQHVERELAGLLNVIESVGSPRNFVALVDLIDSVLSLKSDQIGRARLTGRRPTTPYRLAERTDVAGPRRYCNYVQQTRKYK